MMTSGYIDYCHRNHSLIYSNTINTVDCTRIQQLLMSQVDEDDQQHLTSAQLPLFATTHTGGQYRTSRPLLTAKLPIRSDSNIIQQHVTISSSNYETNPISPLIISSPTASTICNNQQQPVIQYVSASTRTPPSTDDDRNIPSDESDGDQLFVDVEALDDSDIITIDDGDTITIDETPTTSVCPTTRNNQLETLDETPTTSTTSPTSVNPTTRSNQRRAHIDFYRKLKFTINVYKNKRLKCQLCNEIVPVDENSVREHVGRHSSVALYACALCSDGLFETKAKSEMYAHIESAHTSDAYKTAVQDRRDMLALGNILDRCFPRENTTAASSRSHYNAYKETVDQLCLIVSRRRVTKIKCVLCHRYVTQVDRRGIIAHLHEHHPYFRCKRCGIRSAVYKSIAIVKSHLIDAHGIDQPQPAVDYRVSTSPIAMLEVVQHAFPSYFGTNNNAPPVEKKKKK